MHRLANALVRRGEDVTCYSFSPLPPDALYKHVRLHFESNNSLINKFVPAIRFRLIDKRLYDVLHFHGDDFLCAGGNRRIRTFYGSAFWEARFAARPGRFFYQSVFYAFEWLSCMRKGTLVGISRITSVPLPRIRTEIPCGVPLDRYNPGTMKTKDPSILFIGDLDSRKRGRFLIETFGRTVLPAFPRACLTVIGPQKAAGAGIRFTGRLDETDLIEEYRKAWIYCSVSSYEGFGVPLVEAMACGTAVIAADNSGAREIITDGSDGLLSSDRNLGETLVRLISEIPLRESIIKNGLRTSQKYDIAEIARRYAGLYHKCLENTHEQ